MLMTRSQVSIVSYLHFFFSDCPIDLTGGQESVVMKSPQLAEQQKTSQASSATMSTKTPKRANLISLGFKPITKTPTNSADCVEQGNDAKPAEEPAQNSIQSKQGMPRRISFVTVTNASTGIIISNDYF